ANTTASSNGYANDGVAANGSSNTPGASVVTVRVYPNNYQGGPNAGSKVPKGCAEATVTYYQGRTFSNVFGSGSIPLSARAVARGRSLNVGVLTLNSSGASNGVNLSASASVDTPGAVLVNSSDSSALNLGSGASLSASAIEVRGGTNTTTN